MGKPSQEGPASCMGIGGRKNGHAMMDKQASIKR
jgi:hypothetical protein